MILFGRSESQSSLASATRLMAIEKEGPVSPDMEHLGLAAPEELFDLGRGLSTVAFPHLADERIISR